MIAMIDLFIFSELCNFQSGETANHLLKGVVSIKWGDVKGRYSNSVRIHRHDCS